MNLDKYIDLRRCYMEFYPKIIESTDMGNSIRRAGNKLGFLVGDIMNFETDVESDAFMDYLLYEKNGRNNTLIDRYSLLEDEELTDNEELLLSGMANNYLSLFEVKQGHASHGTVELIDLISGEKYIMIDIGMSQSPPVGCLLFTRLIPIGNVNMTSGMLFIFHPDKKDRLLDKLTKKKEYRLRKSKPKINAKRHPTKSSLEIMLEANRNWGIKVITQEV